MSLSFCCSSVLAYGCQKSRHLDYWLFGYLVIGYQIIEKIILRSFHICGFIGHICYDFGSFSLLIILQCLYVKTMIYFLFFVRVPSFWPSFFSFLTVNAKEMTLHVRFVEGLWILSMRNILAKDYDNVFK